MDSEANWTLMSTHGTLLTYLSNNPGSTVGQASQALGLTVRRIKQLMRDLAHEDMIRARQDSRPSCYEVNRAASCRHPVLGRVPVSAVLESWLPN